MRIKSYGSLEGFAAFNAEEARARGSQFGGYVRR